MSTRWPRRRQRWLLWWGLLVVVAPLLACGTVSQVGRTSRWACPSPTPKPYGERGPVKEIIRHYHPTATPSGPIAWDEEYIYYEEWEQEYGHLGGPPFPAPTPFGLVGTNYVFGQRVEVFPLHVLVTAAAKEVVVSPSIAPTTKQRYEITITWYNHTTEALPIDYLAQVRLRAITTPTGAVLSSDQWGVTELALTIAQMDALPTTIPAGESTVQLPILAPLGTPKTVDITFMVDPDDQPRIPTAITLSGTPTSTPAPTARPRGTPTPNTDLRAEGGTTLTVQWSNTRLQIPNAPECRDPGAMTDWETSSAWGAPVAVSIPAPAGAGRVVQIALNQVGKPYVWGAKGPKRFDCSGLVSWSYAQIGIPIPAGTAGQWPGMRSVDGTGVQPGDLIFFHVAGARIDHVGMLIGDLNGDQRWDMVHAATPQLGVRVEYSVFESAFWKPRIAGFRTAR